METSSLFAQEPPPPPNPIRFSREKAVLVTVSEQGSAQVERLSTDQTLPATPPFGLLVWKPAFGPERWSFLKAGGDWPDESVSFPQSLASVASRGGDDRGVGGAVVAGSLVATIQLESLDGTTLARGAALITPCDGAELLSNRPTFRRAASGKADNLPAATAIPLLA